MTTIKINISEISQGQCSGKFKTENHLESLPSQLSPHVTSVAWQELITNVDVIMEEHYQQIHQLALLENIFKWSPVFVISLYIGWKNKLKDVESLLSGLFILTVVISALISFNLRRKLVSSSEVAEMRLKDAFRNLIRNEDVSIEIESEKRMWGNNRRVKYIVEITVGDIETQNSVVETDVEATQIDNGVAVSPISPIISSNQASGIPSSSTTFGSSDYEVVQPQLVTATIIQGSSSPSISAKMNGKKCKQCGDRNERGAKFCANCGSKL